MPYTFPGNIPEKIKSLPVEAQKIWIKIFNSAWEQYKDRADKEKIAAQTAWTGLKKAGWIKRNDKWVEMRKSGIELPYIVKNSVLLREGKANELFYSGEEIKKAVPYLNTPVDEEDIEERNKASIFYDHDEKCENWLGDIKNFRYDEKEKALVGDIYLVDEDAAIKTKYQIDEKLTRWGISPRLEVSEKDGKAFNLRIKTFSLVLRPAGGSNLMLEEKFSLEAGGSDLEEGEKFSLDDELDKIEFDLNENEELEYKCSCIKCGFKMVSDNHCDSLKCPQCGGQMRREDRPGPGQEKSSEGLELLAKEFSLSSEEIKTFTEDQIALLKECSQPELLRKSEENILNEQEIIEQREEKEDQETKKNQEAIILNSETPILCYSEEEQTVKGIIREPEKIDTFNHVMSEEIIRESMIDYMMNYRVLDVEHADKGGKLFPLKEKRLGEEERKEWADKLRLIENYQTDSDQYLGDPLRLVRKGAWIQTWKILDSEIWNDIKKGKYTGFSSGGVGSLKEE